MREPEEHPYCPALKRNLEFLSARRARQSQEIEDARSAVSDRKRELERLQSEPFRLTDLIGSRGSRGGGRRGRDQDDDEEDRQKREAAENAAEIAEEVAEEAQRRHRSEVRNAEARLRIAERNLAQAESRYDDTDRALSMNVQRYKTYGCQDNILNFIRM